MSGNSHVGRFVDVDLLIVTWLNNFGAISPASALTVVPTAIPATGVVWVASIGGQSDWSEARPRFDLQCLVPGAYGAATALAAAAHNAMDALGGQIVLGQLVHLVHCRAIPTRRQWSDTVDRMIATYELRLPVL